jgi:chaperone required for assembly of F1-ATPase
MSENGSGGERRLRSSQDEVPRLKRFYKSVGVVPAGSDASASGFAVILDERPLRTPARRSLTLPTRALCEAVGEEWDAQGDFIEPADMPLTKLANTCIDGIVPQPGPVAGDILAFAGNDLLCYRAEHPRELQQKQSLAWDPVLQWAEAEARVGRFALTAGVMPVEQPRELLDGLQSLIAGLDPWALGPVHVITTLTGSAVLALAVEAGEVKAEDAWAAAHVDEDWQIEQWGEDAEATQRRALREREMLAACRFIELLRDGN